MTSTMAAMARADDGPERAARADDGEDGSPRIRAPRETTVSKGSGGAREKKYATNTVISSTMRWCC